MTGVKGLPEAATPPNKMTVSSRWNAPGAALYSKILDDLPKEVVSLDAISNIIELR
jgi:hypothetical protein